MKKRLTEWPLQHILPVFSPFLPGQALFAWWQRLMTMEYACTMEIPQHLLSVLVWKRRWFDRKLRIPDAHQTLDELLNIYRHFINWRNLCLGYKECGKKGELGRRKRSIHSFVWSRIWVRSTGFIFILFSESTDMIHIYIIISSYRYSSNILMLRAAVCYSASFAVWNAPCFAAILNFEVYIYIKLLRLLEWAGC